MGWQRSAALDCGLAAVTGLELARVLLTVGEDRRARDIAEEAAAVFEPLGSVRELATSKPICAFVPAAANDGSNGSAATAAPIPSVPRRKSSLSLSLRAATMAMKLAIDPPVVSTPPLFFP